MSRILMAVLLTISFSASSLYAQQRIPQLPSLGLVPADAAFYGVSLRGKEQFDKLMGSNAVKKLMTSSYVQLAWDQAKQQMENEPQMGAVLELLKRPENKELLDVLADGLSNEVFTYGDQSLADVILLLNQFSGAMRAAQIEMATNGGDEELMRVRILQFFIDNQQNLEVPELVLGMRISDKQAAQRQVDRLVEVAAMLEGSPLAGAGKTEQIGDATLRTITIKGSMLPLEDLEREFEEFETEEGKQAASKIMDIIRSRTVSLSVGLWNDYLLFSIGPNSGHLAEFGKGKVLSKHPKLRPLAKHINKKLVAVEFVSGDFLKAIGSAQSQLDDVAAMVEAGTALAPINDEVKKALAKDAQKLAKEIGEMIPEPDALLSFAFMVDQGYEGYAYNWGESNIDASKPLTILDHVGGAPIFFGAGRTKVLQPDPAKRKYWGKQFEYYLQNLVMPNLPGPQQGMVQKLYTEMKPIVASAAEVNQNLLRPALADAQSAFVFDGKLMSTQPHRSMPQPEKQLPLPETAIVLGVSDEAKFTDAIKAYFALGDKMIDAARRVYAEIPPFQIPRGVPQTTNNTTVYAYPGGFLLGLDMAISPNGGVGNGVAAMSLTPETSVRLINGTPLTNFEFIHGYAQKPIGAAAGLDFAALMEMAHDWADYAVVVQNPGDDSVALIKQELKILFDVLGCFRSAAGVSYQEDGAIVTHSRSILQDLKQ